jgi:hypothetical protein
MKTIRRPWPAVVIRHVGPCPLAGPEGTRLAGTADATESRRIMPTRLAQ